MNLRPSRQTNDGAKETRQKPRSLGAASRIPGVSPADIAVLMVWLEKQEKSAASPRMNPRPARQTNYGRGKPARVRALRLEARQKLVRQKPRSLGAASRIPGVSPADIAVLMVWLEKQEKSAASPA